MNADAFVKYNQVIFNPGGGRRKSQKKHSHDLTEFYKLSFDSTKVVTVRDAFNKLRPVPLKADEYALYQYMFTRKNYSGWLVEDFSKQEEKKGSVFWGQLGDMLISSYSVNLAGIGSVKCSPLINPVMLDYSHSRGVNKINCFLCTCIKCNLSTCYCGYSSWILLEVLQQSITRNYTSNSSSFSFRYC